MPLAEKVTRCGLDLSRRTRPTLAMLPRGNWIRHYYYDFPALLSGGLDQLVDYCVSRFSRAAASHAFAVDRFILAAHSGGGMPAVDIIGEASHPPDEFYIFDGFYGRDPASGNPFRGLEVIDSGVSRNWLLAAAYPLFALMPPSRNRFTARIHWLGWSAYLIARRPSPPSAP